MALEHVSVILLRKGACAECEAENLVVSEGYLSRLLICVSWDLNLNTLVWEMGVLWPCPLSATGLVA